ncbi:MAG: biopolymer transporter ExbD [bacterium]|nr:biopolymer transporter ExbD [bacterium]
MRLSKRKRTTSAAMNMTPMIDIVFLLIIFFMTVSQISEVNKTPVELPRESGEDVEQPAEIIINITQAEDYIIASKPYDLGGVISYVSQVIARKSGNVGLVSIVLRVDRRSTSRPVNEVSAALNQLGLTQVRFGVQHKEL